MNELDPEYKALIESNRLSSETRAVLLRRMEPVEQPASTDGLSRDAVRTLQTMAERIAPMSGRSIDFGMRINARLASGEGKGWRYSELPSNLAAYRAAIKTIDNFCLHRFAASFCDLQSETQIHTLTLLQRRELVNSHLDLGSHPDLLDAAQMQRWFEDLRADVAALYIAHPETLSQLGYSGIADGVDSESLSGFVELGLGKTEPWEPKGKGTRR